MNTPTTPEDQKKFKSKAHSDGYKRIFELGQERVALLNSYLINDYTIPSILKILREDWGVMADVKDEALRRQLLRYKRDFVLPKQAQIASKLTSNHQVARLAAVTAQVEAGVDVVRTMEWAVKLQVARIEKGAVIEDKLPTLQESQTKNLDLLTKMLVALGQTQMDVGLLKRVPAKLAFSLDVSDEDRKFMESCRLQDMEAQATVEAMRYLRGQGVIEGEFTEVDRGP